ncbi:MAG: peptide ABC transporter permease [Clostridiales bacterium]|nr:MAG: peptide ABC transporter permease [Clostridiales bacterium]
MNLSYLSKKLFHSFITLFIVVTINFFLFRIMPGDPFAMIAKAANLSTEYKEQLSALYGYNEPFPIQYVKYLKQLANLDFGLSFKYRKPVMDIIGSRLMATLTLAFIAQLLAIVLGMFFGTISAAFRGKKIDVLALGFALFIYSIPAFWLGIVLVSFFSVKMGWLPLNGMVVAGAVHTTTGAYIADVAKHLVLPVITLGLAITGGYTMIMRGSLLDVLTEDYITTARAKGFTRRKIVIKHALPNAMLPMVTVIAINFGFMIGGAIQTETVYSWPGIGRLIYEALMARDYPILQGAFLIISITVIVANFIADILYGYLDPRIKYD